jgi:hypothetical protein
MTTFYLFAQHKYDMTSTRNFYAHLNHSFVLLLTTQEQPRQRKFKSDLGINVYETPISQSTREEHIKHDTHALLRLVMASLYYLRANQTFLARRVNLNNQKRTSRIFRTAAQQLLVLVITLQILIQK